MKDLSDKSRLTESELYANEERSNLGDSQSQTNPDSSLEKRKKMEENNRESF